MKNYPLLAIKAKLNSNLENYTGFYLHMRALLEIIHRKHHEKR
jgi:hypothetical protein